MVYLYWKEVFHLNESLYQLMMNYHGTILRSDIEKHNISPSALTRALRDKEIEKITTGVYTLANTFPDEYWYRQRKFSKGIFSHRSALILHNLTDLNTEQYSMTFPRGYRNSKGLKRYFITPYFVYPEILELGVENFISPSGNEILVYSKERTLIDIWNPRLKFDATTKQEALKRYMALPNKQIHRIAILENKLGKRDELRKALEVLL